MQFGLLQSAHNRHWQKRLGMISKEVAFLPPKHAIYEIKMDDDRIFSGFLIWVGLAVSLSGLAVLGYQTFLFLRDGEWISYSLLYLVKILPNGILLWARDPDSWFGLHKILNDLPLSGDLLLVGSCIIFVATWIWTRD